MTPQQRPDRTDHFFAAYLLESALGEIASAMQDIAAAARPHAAPSIASEAEGLIELLNKARAQVEALRNGLLEEL